MEPDAVEMRVLGCLIEKQRTTPDAYPLTLNSLRIACNQSTNREPVVDYSESDVRGALDRLGRRHWTRLASWSSGRSMKYRHLVGETLGLSEPELAVLAVLMLRGAQTPGELRSRADRLHRSGDGELEPLLGRLEERRLVRLLPRRPGQREQRYEQLLGGVEGALDAPNMEPPGEASAAVSGPVAPPPPPAGDLAERVHRLESELIAVRGELRALRDELGA